MALDHLEIHGFRGFAAKQRLSLAVPNGDPGSGLTVLIGPNSGGKSTVLEAIRHLAAARPPSFRVGRRNNAADSRVEISAGVGDSVVGFRTTPRGGSETEWLEGVSPSGTLPKIYMLPSRRHFNPYFGKASTRREPFTAQQSAEAESGVRGSSLDRFSGRLFEALDNSDAFNPVIGRVLGFRPEWTIDQSNTGQYFLKFTSGEHSHDSDGLGEGIVSLFFIVDALYDAPEGSLIAIDEPELSLHPIFQRRLMTLLREYAARRQIIYATHSPYFVDFADVAAGAQVVRLATCDGACEVSPLSEEVGKQIAGLLKNKNNPHILGLDAREAFFQSEGIVLVEGQEDVVFYPEVTSQIGVDAEWNYFGWGVGGAGNMEVIAGVLQDLGFLKVAGLLDADKAADREQLQNRFPNYYFACIPAGDVRTKGARREKPATAGLLDEHGKIRPEYSHATGSVLQKVREFLDGNG